MARDPLSVLRKVRDIAVTEATRDLASALAREREQVRLLEANKSLMDFERSHTGDEYGADLAIWLSFARQRDENLRAVLQTEEVRVSRARQALALRRTDAKAVVKILEQRQAEIALIHARQDQAIMDEAAARRWNSNSED